MGADYFIENSNVIINLIYADKILNSLDFIADDGKSIKENLTDCLEDYGWKLKSSNKRQLTFIFEPDDDIEFDWSVYEQLAPFLVDGSFVEENSGELPDEYYENDEDIRGFVVGLIEKGKVKRQLYAVTEKEDGKINRVFVRDLSEEDWA